MTGVELEAWTMNSQPLCSYNKEGDHTSSMVTAMGTTTCQQGQQECFHLSTPSKLCSLVATVMYIAWQQWRREGQWLHIQYRLCQREYVSQETVSNRNRSNATAAIAILDPPRHWLSAVIRVLSAVHAFSYLSRWVRVHGVQISMQVVHMPYVSVQFQLVTQFLCVHIHVLSFWYDCVSCSCMQWLHMSRSGSPHNVMHSSS